MAVITLIFPIVSFRPPMRTGSSVILIALAVFDNLALIIGLLDHFLQMTQGIYVDILSPFACKSFAYIRAVIDYVGGYLIVVFTVFRVISVYLPHKNAVYCTRSRAYIAVFLTIIALCFVHLDYVLNVQYYPIYENSTYIDMDCWYVGGGLTFFVDYYQYFLVCVRSVIPFSILIIGNSMIIYKISKFRAKRQAMTNINQVSNSSSDDTHGMTAMLISISILFLITQTPYLITNNISYTIAEAEHSPEFLAKYYLLETYFRFLTFVNNVANFLCYCISGRKFKSELVTMLKEWFHCSGKTKVDRGSCITISTVT